MTLIIFAAIAAVSLIVLLVTSHFAPEGWQDRNGFHFGPRFRESDQECAAHCHAELDGAGLPTGLISHFHTKGDTRG